MEVLAARLSQLDTQAEGAIRVVMFYDTLMRRRVDLPALARASAGLAECVAGIRLRASGRAIRRAPDGSEAPEPSEVAGSAAGPGTVTGLGSAAGSAAGAGPAAGSAGGAPTHRASTTVAVTLDDEEIGEVWLERPGPAGPLDELLLDRLALAVAGVVERYGPARTTMADPALVELVISADSDEAARARALRLLGFAVGAPVRVVAVRSPLPLDQVAAALCPARPVKAAPLAAAGAVLATTVDPSRLPAQVRAGLGGSDAPDRAWREARTALRFTTARRPVVRHADLGALALLAQVPDRALRDNPDVAAVARLAGTPADLDTLDAYCCTGSLRGAADLLHLHHSSVSRRLDHLAKALELDLTAPDGLLRARVALSAWRLLDG
ncbi:helix-turn-helix domain-containing protein [Streptomyces sp. WAC06614]|uniref:helix-turn-helix domain-containing protein n=1 Tax=Streptomyces sp. WAC06614 TaxID=2487416 RepID=UPI000F7AB529|nr:helix-turn-helix domain-containing protein [Streptomyces sp. WAC06614]RSS81933.1 PucR family transcriptional regulator [Streptomyces sp. WAC06614]